MSAGGSHHFSLCTKTLFPPSVPTRFSEAIRWCVNLRESKLYLVPSARQEGAGSQTAKQDGSQRELMLFTDVDVCWPAAWKPPINSDVCVLPISALVEQRSLPEHVHSLLSGMWAGGGTSAKLSAVEAEHQGHADVR